MKTEMKMLDNGNYKSVICPIQHHCLSKDRDWCCTEYSWRPRMLLKTICDTDDEYGFEHTLDVDYCPFCGYKARIIDENQSP